jgi:peptide/nickel transport system substrate-binding protein
VVKREFFSLFIGLSLLLCLDQPKAQETPKAGGSAVIAVPSDPGSLNPAISTSAPIHVIASSIFNGLVSLSREGTPEPDLAESWSVSPDGLTVTFNLRGGVVWHDGKPFTSADVKFSFEDVLLKYHARARSGLSSVVQAIETPDDRRVVFRLKRPHPSLIRQLDVYEAPIVSRHVYAGSDPNQNPGNLAPVGTGPFRFDSYRRDEQIVLVRNPNYFKPGLPRLDRLVFRVIPDATTQVNALIAGEVDVLRSISGLDAQRLRGQPVTIADTTVGPGGSNCIATVSFNLDRPRLADFAVREAIALALDRDQILQLVIFGRGRVAAAPFSSGIPWAQLRGALDGIKPDAAAANRLLDKAGLPRGPDGVRFSLDIYHYNTFSRYSDLMRQQLAAVGIALRPRVMDPPTLVQSVFTDRNFDLALISYCNGQDPEIGIRRMYHSSAVGKVPFSNASGFRDGEVDRLFDIAAGTTDEAVRRDAYHAAQRIIVATLPYFWLVEADSTLAWRDELAGFRPWTGHFAEAAWRRR